ncbi:MAG: hypothetical protein ACRD17_05760 [Terriglobales bacterium]
MTKKIRDLKEELRQLLASFSALPAGFAARVVFERPEEEKRRSIREDADASYFHPEEGHWIRIEFDPPEPARVSVSFAPAELALAQVSASAPLPTHAAISSSGNSRDAVNVRAAMHGVVKTLDHAEHEPGKTFVAIKTFRDRILPQVGLVGEQASVALNGAIEDRLVLTGKIPNPHKPGLWTTTVRLNREDPRVRAILGAGESGPARRFTPSDFGLVSASAEVVGARK